MVKEKSITSSKEYAECILDAVRDPLIALDQDLRVVSVSRSFYEFFKVKPEETLGQLIYDLGNKQWDIPMLRELLETILPRHATFDNYEVEHDFATIGRRIMLLNARQIEREMGKKRLILLAIYDITESKRQEEMLIESEERYRRIFETSSDGIVLLEKREGHIVQANPAAGNMLGYSETEKKWSENELKEEKTFIENALNTLKDIFFVFDLEGKLLRWNKTLNTVTGYINTEIALMKPSDLFRDDDLRKIAEAIQTATKEGSVSVEALLVAKDGRKIPYEFSGSLLRDAHGNPMAISGVARDITVRKKEEEEISLQRKRHNSLLVLHGMTDAKEGEIFDFVLDACLISARSQFGFIGKVNADESIGLISWSEEVMKQCLIHEGPISFSVAKAGLLGQMVRQRRPIIVNDYETSTKFKTGYPEGHVLIKRFLGVPIFVGDRVVAFAGVANKEAEYTKSDVSSLTLILHEMWGLVERKKTEDSLRESEERFRQIAESTKEWIWEANCEGLYTYSSRVVEEMLGYKPEEVVGKKYFYDFVPAGKKEQIKKEGLKSFATKSTFEKYDTSNVHKDGRIVLLETSAISILDNRGDILGYRGITVDVTEQKKLEAQLRHVQKMEAVGTLAGGVAHDFNNILNVILGYGAMVMDKLEAGSPAKEDMHEVLVAANRAADLTKRLLIFSRKQVFEMKPININELIFDLQKMLIRIVKENINLKLDLADRPFIVHADAGQIEHVLINLVSNAKDAMPEGGQMTINTGLEVMDDESVAACGYGNPGRYALITVSDSGKGMNAINQKKIFEPFFTTKGIGEGSGLGLAISYGIIKQHSGYIKVYSEPGRGTTFKISLPLSEEAAFPDKTEVDAPVKGGSETVLVAEDDASLMKLTRIVLESFGYSVISAKDGEDALTKFMENRERISLVLLDMIMPEKNGKEVCEAIRKVCPWMKIIFMSGYTMDIITNKELTEAGFDFINKPFQSKNLLIKVREILDR